MSQGRHTLRSRRHDQSSAYLVGHWSGVTQTMVQPGRIADTFQTETAAVTRQDKWSD